MDNRKRWIDGKAVTFAIFLLAGNLKADPRLSWLPVDLTVLSGMLTVFYVAKSFLENQCRVPRSLLWLWIMYGLFLVPLFWTDFTDYSVEKMAKMFSFTMLCAVAPLFLFKTDRDVRRLFHALAGIGALMAIDAIVLMLLGVYSENSSGITAFGSNTIALGRTTGMALIWVSMLGMEKKQWPLKAAALSVVLVIALVGSGSRGPLLATYLVLGMVGLLFYWKKTNTLSRFASSFLLVSLASLYVITIVPDNASTRIEEFLRGDLSHSELMRVKAYEQSWDLIKKTPEGTGWGGFATQINLWPDASRQYPHNLYLEVLLEGGWIPGLYMCAAVCAGVRRIFGMATTVERRAFFALFLFMIGNAMVSGDFNDNKELFAFLGLSLGYPSSENSLGEQKHEVREKRAG